MADVAGSAWLAFASIMLILKPLAVARFFGGIYWKLAQLTSFDSDKTNKEYFVAKNPFWFRVLGFILLAILGLNLLVYK